MYEMKHGALYIHIFQIKISIRWGYGDATLRKLTLER